MSGVEIAGFILGGFPLLISAAEHYREGFEPLVKWKKFRTDFLAFINRVDAEKQLFDDMLAGFLISADVPEDEIQKFLTVKNYEGWQRQDLVRKLERRLGSSYDVYMSEIETMSKLMKELAEMLSLKNGDYDWAADGASRWNYQLKRLRLSFSKKGDKTISELELHNKKLRELLDSKDRLDTMKASRKDTTLGSLFERIRGHAASLHAALKQNWHCSCKKPHIAGLQLQQFEYSEKSDRDFFMAFNVSEEPSQIAIRRREVIISLEKNVEIEAPAQARLDMLYKANLSNGDIGMLRHNFEHSNPDPQVRKVTRPKFFSSSLKTSASIPSSSLKGLFSRGDSGNGYLKGCESLSDSNSSLPVTKKSVRIDMSFAVDALEPSQTRLSKSQIEEVEVEIGTKIQDLCSEICKSSDGTCHGYLVDDKQRHHIIRAMTPEKYEEAGTQENSVTVFEYITLQTLLQAGSEWALTRRQRFEVACILASSVLQLQSTPWLAERMHKSDILFYRQGDCIFAGRPYIRHAFASSKADTVLPASHAHPDPTYSDPTTKQHHRQNRQPALKTIQATRSSLENLGILLLELCFGQSIESKVALQRRYLMPGEAPNETSNFLTARDWVELVPEEVEDKGMYGAIKCCVLCSFDQKADWSDKRFVQAVHASVVQPLEEMARRWKDV